MLQLLLEVDNVPPDGLGQIDENIEIAPFDLFAPGIRAEDADIDNAVFFFSRGLIALSRSITCSTDPVPEYPREYCQNQ